MERERKGNREREERDRRDEKEWREGTYVLKDERMFLLKQHQTDLRDAARVDKLLCDGVDCDDRRVESLRERKRRQRVDDADGVGDGVYARRAEEEESE